MKVPLVGDTSAAVIEIENTDEFNNVGSDILVVGGGMGGVSSALAAAREGHSVCLIEETDWLGGQITSQGVSALDEHDYIEDFGGTRSYYQLRESIRNYYRELASDPDVKEPLNPGTCWVSRLSFEPRIALQTINSMLDPYVKQGLLKIFLRMKTIETVVNNDSVSSLKAIHLDDKKITEFRFKYVLDASELGDLLPLTGTKYIIGAESIQQTCEPHAQPKEAKEHCVQSCTYIFAMEHRPEETHILDRPEGYFNYKDKQPYSLRIHVEGGEIYGEESGWLNYHLFDQTPNTKGPLWLYRRLVDANQFKGQYENDITMFNWPGTDYRDMPLVDQTPENLAKALQEAKRVSLGFAYWLQSESMDAGGKKGNTNIMLRPDVMGSEDGLSKYPYIRECRRIAAMTMIREHDVSINHQSGPRARLFQDSVGIGWYPIDIHQAGEGDIGTSTRTKPFQIPLGALIPIQTKNLIAANKNIGTTHITNGCYRLHPIEWNIGESAGLLASYACKTKTLPRDIHSTESLLREFQSTLIKNGVPIHWLMDVPVDHPDFDVVQKFVTEAGPGNTDNGLNFNPESLIDNLDLEYWDHVIPQNLSGTKRKTKLITRIEFARQMSANNQ